jgi:hypothetical protein
MPDPASGTQSLLPVVVEEVDFVRVEKSLDYLSFFASTTSENISRTRYRGHPEPGSADDCRP